MNEGGSRTDRLAVRVGIDPEAFDRIFERLYADLRNLARAQRRRTPTSSTLDTTAVIHEAYLRLARGRPGPLSDRGHFLAVAARAMRFVLIDDARGRVTQRRGGGALHLPLEEQLDAAAASRPEMLLALDAALDRLGDVRPRLVQVVECRYFAGLSEQETADSLGISLRTVQRDWNLARAKLQVELAGGEVDP